MVDDGVRAPLDAGGWGQRDGERLTITATITDYEGSIESSTVIVAVIVNRPVFRKAGTRSYILPRIGKNLMEKSGFSRLCRLSACSYILG